MNNPLNKPYRITSPFGWRTLGGKRDLHNGIDLVPLDGVHPTKLYATASGIVEDVRNNVPNTHTGLKVTTMITGNYINIRTAEGFTIIYRHLKYDSIPFTKGQKVNQGDYVGIMHTTGQSTGIHLHYEIRNPQNIALNPLDYLYGVKSISSTPTTQTPAPTSTKVQTTPTASTGAFNVGDSVVLNGAVHADSYGMGKGRTFTNKRGKITIVADSKRICPYHFENLGWVQAVDLVRG